MGTLTSIIALSEYFQIVQLYGIPAKYTRQELVVSHVLELGREDAPTVLEQLLVVPVRINLSQFVDDTVVFSHVNGVDGSQTGLLAGSSVTYQKSKRH